jgi:hypothetical protein
MFKNQRVWLPFLGAWLAASPAAGQAPINDPNVFCTGDPCIITEDVDIPNLSDVDFGSRHVILRATLDVGAGTFFLSAGRLTIDPDGQFRAKGPLGFNGGELDILVTGDIEVNGSLLAGAFDLNGVSGGSLSLVSDTGSITGTGKIRSSANQPQGDGGELFLSAGQSIVLTGRIEAAGGATGGGGLFAEFNAIGDVNVPDLDLSGGDFGGGDLFIDAGGDVTLGDADFRGTNAGDGGELDVISEGSIEILGQLFLRGATLVDTSFGGVLDLDASQDRIHVAPTGSIVLTGSACGGDLTFDAPVIFVEGSIEADGTSASSCGGVVDMLADNDLTLNSPIRADGGSGGGPFVDLFSTGSIDILSDVNGDSAGTGINTGSVRVVASGPVQIGATATLSADGLSGGNGGDVQLRGCSVNVSAGVSLSARGTDGKIDVSDGDQMTLAGDFQAGPGGVGAIELRHRNLAQVPITTGATFNIAPTIIHDSSLPNCDRDADGVLNFGDNCPHTANAGQDDNGGVASPSDPDGAIPDGIGDVCQCGDVTDDGHVNVNDLGMLRDALAGVASISVPEKCNVREAADVSSQDAFGITPDCKMNDSSVLERQLSGLAPGIDQVCAPAQEQAL